MRRLVSPKDLDTVSSREGALLIIDVRSPEEYAAGHVTGAVNIPVDDLAAHLDDLKGQTVVSYCNMYHPGHSRGERAADFLGSKGIDACVLEGGYPNWYKDIYCKSEEDKRG